MLQSGGDTISNGPQVGGVATPPPPLHKHHESQENDGHTGSWCLDKAVHPCNAPYQKNKCL